MHTVTMYTVTMHTVTMPIVLLLLLLLCHQVYHGELEDAFSDFTDLAQTFPLFRGKGKRDPDDPEGQTVGYFKGAIKVYPLPDDGSPDPPKILSNIPSSKPIKVIVRIYIIKGIDLQPQDPDGKV